MYPLFLFSVVALGLFLERLYYFRRLRVDVHAWFQNLPSSNSVSAPTWQKLKKHPLKEVLSNIWKNRDLPPRDLEALAQEESEHQMRLLETNLKPLAVIALLSPLVGLLGTVLGIMKAFQQTAGTSQVSPTLLAGGIWEALITTFVGLAIAIPTWLAYYYLESRLGKVIFQLEFYSSRFLRIAKGSESTPTPSSLSTNLEQRASGTGP